MEGLRPAQALARQAVAAGPVPRLPVPDRRPRPVGGVVHPQRGQREAPGHRQEPRRRPDGLDARRDLDARVPAHDAREDGAPQDGGQLRRALRERRLLGRREEAARDAPDGDAGPRVRDPRRDRFRARHRRPADRRRGRQRDAQPEHGRAADHALPAPAQLHHARLRARPGGGPDRRPRAARTSRSGSRRRATARSCARTASRSTCPTRRSRSRWSPKPPRRDARRRR